MDRCRPIDLTIQQTHRIVLEIISTSLDLACTYLGLAGSCPEPERARRFIRKASKLLDQIDGTMQRHAGLLSEVEEFHFVRAQLIETLLAMEQDAVVSRHALVPDSPPEPDDLLVATALS